MARFKRIHVYAVTDEGEIIHSEPRNDTDGRIVLREPSAMEMNAYSYRAFKSVEGMVSCVDIEGANCDLFDACLQSIDGVDGASVEDKTSIPDRVKSQIVNHAFGRLLRVDVKN